MTIKNLQSIISEAISYADVITNNHSIYPADAKMPLKDLMRFDMIMFMGYLADTGNKNFPDQVEYIRQNLRMVLQDEKFKEFIAQKCSDPNYLNTPPQSLEYFIQADQQVGAVVSEQDITKSKFLVDTFRKLGEGFTNYDDIKPEYVARLVDYIRMMNDHLVKEGIMNPPKPSGIHMKSYDKPTESGATKKTVPDLEHVKTYDEASGRFTVKKAISTEGHKIMKKRADDISEFANLVKDEKPNESISRGKNKIGANRKGDESEERDKPLDELIQDLQDLIGLDSVKKDLMHIINIIKVRKLREIQGLKRIEMSFHLVFTGNPGTGKTTVARLLAKIYKQLGVVSKGQFIEVDRSGLVDHYPGGTAQKTTQVIDRAIGGILFIDEAYSLTHKKESGDYGQEAVDTLLKRMEDDRDDLIVIVAGYPGPMEEFIESNPGLRSRFNKYIRFPDYKDTELMDIFRLMCKENDYLLTESSAFVAETYLRGIAEVKTDNFANARLVRNYFERCVDRQATRICQDPNMDSADLVTFVREDMLEDPANAVNVTKLEKQDKVL